MRFMITEEFAILEAGYLVVRLLQRFPTLHLPADERMQEVGEERQKLTLVLSSADGCRVILKK